MRLITVDGNYMLPTDWKLGVNIYAYKSLLSEFNSYFLILGKLLL